MRRTLVPLTLVVFLSLAACGKEGGSPTDPSGGPTGGPTGGGPTGGGTTGGTPSSDPLENGTWTSPDGNPPAVQPVDSTTYTPAGEGSGASSGASTSLVFQTSGTARYNAGTCGRDGTWTDALGNSYGPHNPNCLAYSSDGRAGNNNKGQCVTSPEGYAGLWLNPQSHPTSAYHANCLQLGTVTTAFTLSFPAQAALYAATDGSGGSILNFTSGGEVVAQLVYHATDGTTTGAGVLLGTDNAATPKTWSIGFAQPALNYTAGFANGDLVSAMQGSGVQVVACNSAVGCSLVTLKVTLTP